MEVNPFLLSDDELDQWIAEQDKKEKEIHNLLTQLKFIPSLWSNDNNTYIVSKSAKKENMLQLTCFNKNNIPCYDLIRSLDNLSDIVSELMETTIQQINYIN